MIEPLESRIAPAFAAGGLLSHLSGHSGFQISGSHVFLPSVSDAGDVNGDGFSDIIIGTPHAHPHGELSGAAYVVFGRGGGFGAHLDLSSLNGHNGFKITGPSHSAGDMLGYSVGAAGDVNGDGLDDIIIGASGFGGFSGAAYVIFGKASGFAPKLNILKLDGSRGFQIEGGRPGAEAGKSVSGAGDVNGDGFADVIVGAEFAGTNEPDSYNGSAFVVFGKSSGFEATISVTSLDGSNGFEIRGDPIGDLAGHSVSNAGDFNGDGLGDLLVGAPRNLSSAGLVGAAYVVFGSTSGFESTVMLNELDGHNGFGLRGVESLDETGRAVSSAGDINGDGFDDIVIGAHDVEAGLGAAYVVFGGARQFLPNFDLATLDGMNGFRIIGEPFSGPSVGYSVKGVGDFNGDGISDVILGAPFAKAGRGAAYVILGIRTASSAELKVADLDGTNGFKLKGSGPFRFAGISVSGGGDVNGDGFSDLLIGAGISGETGQGRGGVYVVFGGDSGRLRISTGKEIATDSRFHENDVTASSCVRGSE